MYNPRDFKIEDRGILFDFMGRNNFATFITVQDGVPVATHLPFIVRPDEGENGTLVAHMARANGQWQTLRDDQEALVIFHGPHAYVSPSWYEAQPSVPTWNYLTVHARGKPRLIEDEATVRELLHSLIGQHESPDSGWTMASAEEYVSRMLRSIMAFEIGITTIEGKFKLSQNRDQADRRGVIAALAASKDETERAVAEAMKAALP